MIRDLLNRQSHSPPGDSRAPLFAHRWVSRRSLAEFGLRMLHLVLLLLFGGVFLLAQILATQVVPAFLYPQWLTPTLLTALLVALIRIEGFWGYEREGIDFSQRVELPDGYSIPFWLVAAVSLALFDTLVLLALPVFVTLTLPWSPTLAIVGVVVIFIFSYPLEVRFVRWLEKRAFV